MNPFQVLTASEQVAEHLRSQLLQGLWQGTMPGEDRLMAELGVGRNTVKTALRHLEKEGILEGQGTGRRRHILMSGEKASRTLRITILRYETSDSSLSYVVALQHQLNEAGHVVRFAARSLMDMKMDAKQVARMAEQTETDAWVVIAGSPEILKWFAMQPVPTFALFGRFRRLPIAGTGPDKSSAYQQAVRRLMALGHRRIVMLARSDRRKPEPGFVERVFLEELKAQGIMTGIYNLPDWEDDAKGLRACLDSLFNGPTPPSALLIHTAFLFHPAAQHLAHQGILAPQNVSLICTDDDSTFEWCNPTIACIRWDNQPLVRRIVRWASHVAQGKNDRSHRFSKAIFIEGGTIGPAPRT